MILNIEIDEALGDALDKQAKRGRRSRRSQATLIIESTIEMIEAGDIEVTVSGLEIVPKSSAPKKREFALKS